MGLELERGLELFLKEKLKQSITYPFLCFGCHSFTSEAQRTFVTLHFACSVILCPQNSAPAISLSRKWWLRVLEIPKSCTLSMGRLSGHHKGSNFFLFGEGGGVRLFFPLVPNVFPMCSHHFPMGSLSGSQRVLLIPTLFPKTFLIAPWVVLPYLMFFAQSLTLILYIGWVTLEHYLNSIFGVSRGWKQFFVW